MKKKKSGFVLSGLDVSSNEQVNYVIPWKIKEKILKKKGAYLTFRFNRVSKNKVLKDFL